MKEVEKAYIAGIIDGEGTVSLVKHRSNGMVAPYLSVANTNLTLLEWLKDKTNCGVICTKKKSKEIHKQSYAWTVRYDNAIRILTTLNKYLIIKKEQANLIITHYKKVTNRNGKYDEESKAKKMDLVSKIRELNKR